MNGAAPAEARCSGHPHVSASWTCGRCGNFICLDCERRTRPDALPMCPSCWALRAQKVVPQKTQSGTALQTAGLVLGCVSLLPIWVVHLISLVVNIVAIVKAKEPPARDVRWRPIVGLALTCVGLLLMVALYNFIISRSGA